MSVRRRTKDDSPEPPGDEEENVTEEEEGAEGGAVGGGVEESEELDLRSLYNLLKSAIKTQERESYKHEQRWRTVQVQLNNVWDELDTERRGDADGRQRPGAGAVGPPSPVSPRPGTSQGPAAPSPVSPRPGTSQGPAAPSSVAQRPAATMSPVGQSALPNPVPVPATSRYSPPDLAAPSPVAWTRAAVPKLEEGDDIEQYLTTFERLAAAYQWPRGNWAVYLVPYLTGRARAAYVAMDSFEAMDYDRVKEAILTKYEINEEIYRQRFREPDVRQGETPRELYNRLRDLYRKWIKPAGKTVEEVGEILILEQYLRTLAPEVRVWVKERRPATGQRAAELVEAFLAARRGPKTFRCQSYSRPTVGGKSGGSGGGVGPRGSEQSRAPDMKTYSSPPTSQPRPLYTSPNTSQHKQAPGPTTTVNRTSVTCHYCSQPGHMIRDCPVRKAKNLCSLPRPGTGGEYMARLPTTPVSVNGKTTVALLDTGSTQTLVQPHLIEQSEEWGKGQLRVCCVNGDEHVYPVADVYLEVKGQAFLFV